MGVMFNLEKDNGYKAKISNICFGLLQEFPISRMTVIDRSRSPDDHRAAEQINSEDLKAVEFVPVPRHVQSIKDNFRPHPFSFFNEVKEDLPMFKGMVEIKPRNRVIRVLAEDQPADKVLMGLMFFRTVSQMFHLNGSCSSPFKELLSKGYSPRVAILGTMFFKNYPFNSEEYTYCLNSVGEDSLFNPGTLNYPALIQYLRQDETYSPWYQESIASQGGYFRDEDFSYDEEFGDSCRYMIDCFSLEPDKTPFMEMGTSYGSFDFSRVSLSKEDFFKLFDLFEQIRRGT